jgi:hypothetical protein
LGTTTTPRDGEFRDLDERVARFEHATGRSPTEYVQAWRSEGIDPPARRPQREGPTPATDRASQAQERDPRGRERAHLGREAHLG